MKRVVSTETEDGDSSAETASLITNNHDRMSDHETEKSSGSSTTSEEVAWQIKAVTDFLMQQMAHLCELMRELEEKQSN